MPDELMEKRHTSCWRDVCWDDWADPITIVCCWCGRVLIEDGVLVTPWVDPDTTV
jgi:hypothetical protein